MLQFNIVERLTPEVDSGRLKNALKMLRADRFQLFAHFDDCELIGVIQSQTDDDLVYACRLTHNGEFSCCTQNLRPCGGLRGKVCKHLLVLMIGLSENGDLNAETSAQWVQASHGHNPKLDIDAMSSIFLQYKGAQAGEVDWRPTETIPEDYYAF